MIDNKILHRAIKYLNGEKAIFKKKFIKRIKRYKKNVIYGVSEYLFIYYFLDNFQLQEIK